MDQRFTNKRALVTGAGQGIGRAIAVALYSAGAQVIALSRTLEKLEDLRKECPSISIVCVDLKDWEATRTAVEKIGHVDFLVNNAGILCAMPFIDSTPEFFERTFDVKVKAVFNVSQVVAKEMIAKGIGGSIVNISGQCPKVGFQDFAVAYASKGAMDQLTRVMALELGKYKIRVNCVNPTIINTLPAETTFNNAEIIHEVNEKLPLGRFGEVEEVAGPVLFLLSDQAAMITGDTLMVDIGWTAV